MAKPKSHLSQGPAPTPAPPGKDVGAAVPSGPYIPPASTYAASSQDTHFQPSSFPYAPGLQKGLEEKQGKAGLQEWPGRFLWRNQERAWPDAAGLKRLGAGRRDDGTDTGKGGGSGIPV